MVAEPSETLAKILQFTPTKKSWLYWLQCDGFIKIGKTTSPQTRIGAYQIGSPHAVKFSLTLWVDDCNWAERLLHKAYAEHCHRGEWFRLEGLVAQDVEFLKHCDLDTVARDVTSTKANRIPGGARELKSPLDPPRKLSLGRPWTAYYIDQMRDDK